MSKLRWQDIPPLQSQPADYASAEMRAFLHGLHQIDPTAQLISTVHDEFILECAPDKHQEVRAYCAALDLKASLQRVQHQGGLEILAATLDRMTPDQRRTFHEQLFSRFCLHCFGPAEVSPGQTCQCNNDE